jgi:hypothetical protein
VRDDRVMLAALAVGLGCYVAGAPLQGDAPGAKDSGEEVVKYFLEHSSDIRWSVWFNTFALAAVMVALALMHHRLPKPHRTVFLTGGIVLVAASMVASWFMAGLAMHPGNLQPSTARLVLDVSNYFGPTLTAATIAMLLPVTWLGFRGGLPRWLGMLSAVVLVEQAVETITIFGRGGFIEPGGAMNFMLGGVLFLVWLLALGWSLGDWGATAPAPDRPDPLPG